MKNHHCYVCLRIDKESNLTKVVFPGDCEEQWGHSSCLEDYNKDLVPKEAHYPRNFNPPNGGRVART